MLERGTLAGTLLTGIRGRSAAVALIVGLIVGAGSAHGQAKFSNQQLNELCTAADRQRQNVCAAYVAGVRHTLDVFKNSLKQRVDYCVPVTVTNREIKETFVAWMGRNAGAVAQSAVSGVIRSIREKYACKSGRETFDF